MGRKPQRNFVKLSLYDGPKIGYKAFCYMVSGKAMKPDKACEAAATFELRGKTAETTKIYKKVLTAYLNHPIAKSKVNMSTNENLLLQKPNPKLTISQDSKLHDLDKELTRLFEEVDFIGQLPINQSDFETICHIIRREAFIGKSCQPNRVPDAVFVTSMVFAARYSHEEARNFWKPYAKLVWRIEGVTQSFQSQCRNRFKEAILTLKNKFKFEFPRRKDGDVVRPVYRHAIIPFYLQDDFASWLKDQQQHLLAISRESLRTLLRTEERSLDYLPPTLRTFIQNPDTADTAVELIFKMVDAIKLYNEGETIENISLSLESSPIERALWDELAKVYAEKEKESRGKRPNAATFQWVWSLDDHEMGLRLANLTIESPTEPDRIIWRSMVENEAEIPQYLKPFVSPDGNWWIDEVILIIPSFKGKVLVLDIKDNILYQREVPLLSHEKYLIFRTTQPEGYGILVDDVHQGLNKGVWYISSQANVIIRNLAGEVIKPQQSLSVPMPFVNELQHAQAGLYELEPPVTIWQHDQQLVVLPPKPISVGQPYLEGKDNEILGLSPTVPPTFSNGHVWLIVPAATPKLINRTTLWLKANQRTIQKPLRELSLTLSDNEILRLDLAHLLPHEPHSYTVELRQNLQPVFASPLQFSVLPNIEIESPDQTLIYSPSNPPTVIFKGISRENILISNKFEVIAINQNWQVTWHNLRSECGLLLKFGENTIPLSWKLQRVFAWLEGPNSGNGSLTITEFEQMTLKIIGTPNLRCAVWIAGEKQKRSLTLDAKGHYSNPIKMDALYDMVRQHHHTRLEIYVGFEQFEWKLVEIQSRLKKQYIIDPVIASRELGKEFIISLLKQAQQVNQIKPYLNPHDIFQLLTLPIDSLRFFKKQDLDLIGFPFSQLLAIYELDNWEKQYGRLPAWAVLRQPIWLHLTNYKINITVYPELASRKGMSGVGYTRYKEQVYIEWKPHHNNYVQVQIGVSQEDHILLHSHRGAKVTLVDIGYDSKLLAKITLDNRGRRLSYKFNTVIDRSCLNKYLTNLKIIVLPDDNPISLQTYQYAIFKLTQRYKINISLQHLMNDMIYNQRWQTSFLLLIQKINVNINIPVFAAMSRFLSAFEVIDHELLWKIDKNVLLVAFLLRYFAYNPKEAAVLCQETNLSLRDLAEMLDIACQTCPELLMWALTWVELFHVHAIS